MKILEDLKKSLEEILKEPFAKDEMYNGNLYEYERGYELDLEEIKVVLNIIQENKELKEENLELHKEINQRIKLKLENERCADKDFIPKSKLKEIIYGDYEDLEIILKIKKIVEGK